MTTKILVALHPGLIDSPAVERVLAIAHRQEVDVLLYSGVYDEQMSGLRSGDDPTLKNLRRVMVAAEERKLELVKSRLTCAKSVTVKSEWQHPIAEGIVSAAEQFGAELIVVSSTRHSALARLVLTNTDWAVLRQATVPVLFAHHREFRPYKTILTAIDPTHPHDELAAFDDELIRQGQRIGDIFEGTLHIGHAYPSQRTVVSDEYTVPVDVAARWKEAHGRAIGDLAERHDISSEFVHMIDQPTSIAIPKLAESTKADLVVIGSISRHFSKEFWISHTTEHVIDHLQCDVLAVRCVHDE